MKDLKAQFLTWKILKIMKDIDDTSKDFVGLNLMILTNKNPISKENSI
jgi:hypothetical protein